MDSQVALGEVLYRAPSDTHRGKVAFLVRELSSFAQTECPLKHYFAPGVYLREIFMPAGAVVIGKIHKTEHFNIIERGACAIVHEDGQHEVLRAPLTFVSKAGVQKVLYVLEDTVWKTVHVTQQRDLERLECELIEPDASYPCVGREDERLAIAEAAR